MIRDRKSGEYHGPGQPGRERRQDTELSADVARATEGLIGQRREIAKRLAETAEASVAREMGISRRQVWKAVKAIRVCFGKAGLRP